MTKIDVGRWSRPHRRLLWQRSEMVGWNGVFSPKSTPGEIDDQRHAALTAVLRYKPVQEQMAALSAESIGNRQATSSAFVKSDSARWGAIIREKASSAD